MSQDRITLVCEGQTRGPDLRWLGLALEKLAESVELARDVDLVPAGSKANLSAMVRGMRKSLGTRRVYAVRDRDFLLADLLGKDEPDGVYSLMRHCIESYMAEPAVLEAVFGSNGMEARLVALAERRFWPDLCRAVLDALGYELRQRRLHLEDDVPASKADVIQIAKLKLDVFRDELAAKPLPVDALVESFERDMRSAPVWMRVNGKGLLRSLAGELDAATLPGGDIEARLFAWCARNGPPAPLVLEMRQLLERLPP